VVNAVVDGGVLGGVDGGVVDGATDVGTDVGLGAGGGVVFLCRVASTRPYARPMISNSPMMPSRMGSHQARPLDCPG
jgi:hypothetical protein